MTAFQCKVVGVIVALSIALVALSCAFGEMGMQRCMRHEMHEGISYLLFVGAMAVGVWVGMGVEARTKQPWLGWVVGIATLFALAFFLSWTGFFPRFAE